MARGSSRQRADPMPAGDPAVVCEPPCRTFDEHRAGDTGVHDLQQRAVDHAGFHRAGPGECLNRHLGRACGHASASGADVLPQAVGVFVLEGFPVRTLRSYLAREIAVSTALVFLALLLLFAFFDALQLRLQQAGDAVLPYQMYLMLPYVLSILALILVARKASYPQALMKPYRKGER